jgi:hypothetical protein
MLEQAAAPEEGVVLEAALVQVALKAERLELRFELEEFAPQRSHCCRICSELDLLVLGMQRPPSF